jgi:hypothetical protein
MSRPINPPQIIYEKRAADATRFFDRCDPKTFTMHYLTVTPNRILAAYRPDLSQRTV